MVGLGEERLEVHQVMDDMRSADVDFLTMGQYLQPTPRHAKVEEFVTPAGVRRLCRDRARQGLPAGRRVAADPVELSCRRRFREDARGARSAAGASRSGLMPRHTETRQLPYTPEQMFDLVADVGRYQRVPALGRRDARPLEQRDRDGRRPDRRLQRASRRRFTSRVAKEPAEPASTSTMSTGRSNICTTTGSSEPRRQGRQRRRFLRRFRVQEPHVRDAGRADVRRGAAAR